MNQKPKLPRYVTHAKRGGVWEPLHGALLESRVQSYLRQKREKARAAHWRRTGVSDRTIGWMRRGGML